MTSPEAGIDHRSESGTRAAVDALIDHHGQVLRQAALRAEQTLSALAAGAATADGMTAFLDYLREEIIPLTQSEDRMMWVDVDDDRRFREDHRRLRSAENVLAMAARSAHPDTPLIAGTVHSILDHLEHHVRREDECLLTWCSEQPPALYRPATWYPLTEGPDVDLDLLPQSDWESAMLPRLQRLRPGQHLDVTSHQPLIALRICVYRLDPHAECYRWTVLEDGPPQWRWQLRRVAGGGD